MNKPLEYTYISRAIIPNPDLKKDTDYPKESDQEDKVTENTS